MKRTALGRYLIKVLFLKKTICGFYFQNVLLRYFIPKVTEFMNSYAVKT